MKIKSQEKRKRVALASQQLILASSLCRENDCELVKFSDIHYRIKGDGWRVDLYPSTSNVYVHPNGDPPQFERPERWTLLEIVKIVLSGKKRAGNPAPVSELAHCWM